MSSKLNCWLFCGSDIWLVHLCSKPWSVPNKACLYTTPWLVICWFQLISRCPLSIYMYCHHFSTCRDGLTYHQCQSTNKCILCLFLKECWRIHSISLEAGRGIHAETCWLDDVFLLDYLGSSLLTGGNIAILCQMTRIPWAYLCVGDSWTSHILSRRRDWLTETVYPLEHTITWRSSINYKMK